MKLIFITGGSKNGKSHIAEDILSQFPGEKYYIATMEPWSKEAGGYIERHHKMRAGKGFITIEKYTDLQDIFWNVQQKPAALVECLGNLCANEMFSAKEKDPVHKILQEIEVLREKTEVLIIVTNQVGDDGMIYEQGTMEYIRILGILNQRIARVADLVIEAVFGIPVVRKGNLLHIWEETI